jgi:Holliday junction resolvase
MALRKRESKLFDRIKKNIKNIHFTRIESSTVNGIPDVHACAEGKSFWIELKSNTYKIPKLDKFQIAWIYNYHKHGGSTRPSCRVP